MRNGRYFAKTEDIFPFSRSILLTKKQFAGTATKTATRKCEHGNDNVGFYRSERSKPAFRYDKILLDMPQLRVQYPHTGYYCVIVPIMTEDEMYNWNGEPYDVAIFVGERCSMDSLPTDQRDNPIKTPHSAEEAEKALLYNAPREQKFEVCTTEDLGKVTDVLVHNLQFLADLHTHSVHDGDKVRDDSHEIHVPKAPTTNVFNGKNVLKVRINQSTIPDPKLVARKGTINFGRQWGLLVGCDESQATSTKGSMDASENPLRDSVCLVDMEDNLAGFVVAIPDVVKGCESSMRSDGPNVVTPELQFQGGSSQVASSSISNGLDDDDISSLGWPWDEEPADCVRSLDDFFVGCADVFDAATI